MSNQRADNPVELEERSRRSLYQRVISRQRGGPRKFVNLSVYAFGLSGLWTGVGSGILPFKVLEALELGRVEIVGYALDKNGALGTLSLLGLVVAAAVQLGAGSLSDRDARLGRRLPYLLVGSLGLATMTIVFGITATFSSLLIAIVAMQVFGNLAQGPANALIIDHVPSSRRGEAAGVLNLFRLLGAGSLTVIVLQFMSRYDANDAQEWLWYSIALMITVLLISIFWTVLTTRPRGGLFIPSFKRRIREQSSEQGSDSKGSRRIRISRSYFAFLVALAFTIAAMSSMQIYALFFLQDVVGLDNPADGADILIVVIVLSAGITVLPAGYLSDRVGRSNLFVVAGGSGVTASLLLLFVSSIGPVLAIGVVVGVSVGLFMTLTWAVANDLVSRASAAKELGYTSIATLAGAAAARFAGIGIDELNDVSENLGYKAILIAVATAFALAAVILARVARDTSIIGRVVPLESSPVPSAPD
jgi:MFS family permease